MVGAGLGRSRFRRLPPCVLWMQAEPFGSETLAFPSAEGKEPYVSRYSERSGDGEAQHPGRRRRARVIAREARGRTRHGENANFSGNGGGLRTPENGARAARAP